MFWQYLHTKRQQLLRCNSEGYWGKLQLLKGYSHNWDETLKAFGATLNDRLPKFSSLISIRLHSLATCDNLCSCAQHHLCLQQLLTLGSSNISIFMKLKKSIWAVNCSLVIIINALKLNGKYILQLNEIMTWFNLSISFHRKMEYRHTPYNLWKISFVTHAWHFEKRYFKL